MISQRSRQFGSLVIAIPLAVALGACAPPAEEVASGPTTTTEPQTPAPPAPPAGPAAPPPGPQAPAEPASPAGVRTTMDAVYAAAQAEEGQATFQTYCTACHNAQEFRGPAFQQHWSGRTVGDLYHFVSTMMPLDAPASLEDQQYAGIVAFFLRQNGYPDGPSELPASREALDQIDFVPVP